MTSSCAWCGIELPPKDGDGFTHGICGDCSVVLHHEAYDFMPDTVKDIVGKARTFRIDVEVLTLIVNAYYAKGVSDGMKGTAPSYRTPLSVELSP